MKIRLTITSKAGTIKKIVEANSREEAELIWLNEYINRTTKIGYIKNLQQAKNFAKVKIKSEKI